MGFQSAGIGHLCSWDRSSAGGLAVLFAGVGFFCGTAGAMATEIGIPFAGVQVPCGGASGVASEVWVQSQDGNRAPKPASSRVFTLLGDGDG